MKNFLLTCIPIILYSFTTLAQEQSNTSNNQQLLLPTYNILGHSQYTIKAKVLDRYVTEYTLMKDNDDATKRTFILNPNTVESFIGNFQREFNLLAAGDATLAKAITDKPDSVRREAKQLFYFYMASERAIETAELAPEAGRLCFSKKVQVQSATISDDGIEAMVRAIIDELQTKDVCNNTVMVPGYASIRIPCELEKSDRESKKEWKERVSAFWKSHRKLEIEEELKSKHDAFRQHAEFIKTTVTTLNKDSTELRALRTKADQIKISLAELEREKGLQQVRIDQDNNAIRRAELAGRFPNFKSVNYADRSSINSVLSVIDEEKKKLQLHETDIYASIRQRQDSIDTNTKQNTPASLGRRTSHLQEQNRLKTDSQVVQNNINRLDELTRKISGLYALTTNLETLNDRLQQLKDDQATIQKQLGVIEAQLSINNAELSRLNNKKLQLCAELAETRKKQPYVDFDISTISIDFNDGFIENIMVEGNLVFPQGECMPGDDPIGTSLKFTNNFPIGFSRRLDYNAYKKRQELYAINAEKMTYTVPLSYIIPDYFEKLETDRRDYSPKDYVVTIDFKTSERCIKLVKDETFKLFEAKVYTDFVGLTDDREPNGLVQTEIARKVYLNTYRYKFPRKMRATLGYLGYIEPEATFSKIENNNRRLLLDVKDRFINAQYAPLKYATTLDLRRYQSFSTGFDINGVSIDLPLIKSTFYLDFGFRYGRTPIRDSLRTGNDNLQVIREKQASDFGVNTTDIYPRLTWEIRSDERYSFIFSYSHHWFYLRDNRFRQVGNSDTFFVTENELGRVRNEYTKIGLYATINPGSDRGRIFARYQYYWQQGFWRTGFHQAQLGYSFYIFGRKT